MFMFANGSGGVRTCSDYGHLLGILHFRLRVRNGRYCLSDVEFRVVGFGALTVRLSRNSFVGDLDLSMSEMMRGVWMVLCLPPDFKCRTLDSWFRFLQVRFCG